MEITSTKKELLSIKLGNPIVASKIPLFKLRPRKVAKIEVMNIIPVCITKISLSTLVFSRGRNK
jgi:hypothetical protein